MEGKEEISHDDQVLELKEKVATSCRILAMLNLVQETRGHVSARIPNSDEMVIRCRGPHERGVAYTTQDTIRRVDFDGLGAEAADGYKVPQELPVHGEIFKVRSDVGCVVHAHPTAAVACAISGLELRPIFGAYDPQAMKLSLGGIPVYSQSILLKNPESMGPVIDLMGDKKVCLLKGHGIIAVGRTVEEATLTVIKLEELARITLQVAQLGKTAADISSEDIAYFTDKKEKGSNYKEMSHDSWTWEYYKLLLAR